MKSENSGAAERSSRLLQTRSSANRGWKYSEVPPALQQLPTTAEANSTTKISSILPSPAASGASGSNQVTYVVEFLEMKSFFLQLFSMLLNFYKMNLKLKFLEIKVFSEGF